MITIAALVFEVFPVFAVSILLLLHSLSLSLTLSFLFSLTFVFFFFFHSCTQIIRLCMPKRINKNHTLCFYRIIKCDLLLISAGSVLFSLLPGPAHWACVCIHFKRVNRFAFGRSQWYLTDWFKANWNFFFSLFRLESCWFTLWSHKTFSYLCSFASSKRSNAVPCFTFSKIKHTKKKKLKRKWLLFFRQFWVSFFSCCALK